MSSASRFIRSLRDLCARLALSDVEISALAMVSPAVVRAARRDGREPTRAPTRKRLIEFVERADRVRDRQALGLP
jgi:hypothetical protein